MRERTGKRALIIGGSIGGLAAGLSGTFTSPCKRVKDISPMLPHNNLLH